jgi:hypothetical protein
VVSAVLLAVAVIVTMLRYPWFRVLDETRMGFDHISPSLAPAHSVPTVEPGEARSRPVAGPAQLPE